MVIVLIPCCNRKRYGGTPEYQPSSLADSLTTNTFDLLMQTRCELASLLGLLPGPDLGFTGEGNRPDFLPAYKRYTGIIYQKGEIESLYPNFKGKLIIISALYGLLDANDLIRYYELKMNDSLKTKTRLSTWWQRRGLRDIIAEYIMAQGSPMVHDLLSDTYRNALKPWPLTGITTYCKYEYPGLYNASNYPRSDDIRKHLISQ